MPGKLHNKTRRALTLNLTTKVAPLRKLYDRRTANADGSTSIAPTRIVIPDSITVLAGKCSGVLADGVAHCPEVAAAIARRDVAWIAEVAAPASEPAIEQGSEEPHRSRRRAG
jgi:hypothetical protein